MDFVRISFKGLGDHQYCRWSITSAAHISNTKTHRVWFMEWDPGASPTQAESKSEDFEAVFFSQCQHSV